MATSKSPEKWTAGARIYSGRRDPTWEISKEVAKKLLELWDALPPSSKAEPSTSRLGYRGVFLRGQGGREWTAFDGVASLSGHGGAEVRIDTAREFEKKLLESAPKDLLAELSAQGIPL
jgi:hypothetical protein